MNYWITTDTHFGHDKMLEYESRPEGFENKILKNHKRIISDNSILIHLGDIVIGDDKLWHNIFFNTVKPYKKWLIKGNHDKKSNTWYLNHGWDFVGDRIVLNMYGLEILHN